MSILAAALEYAQKGWRVVPLHHRDKRPHPKAWQKAATTDAEVVEQWFGDQWPDANVGVVLGKDSGLIDVECDSPEAEEVLLKLFDGNPPMTPTYSASRGKHRLFKWDTSLPFQDKAVFKVGQLEFRTGNGGMGAQSVFPPSIHPSGKQYHWLPGCSPEDCEPAVLPGDFLSRLAVFFTEGTFEGTGLFDKEAASGPARKPQEHWDKIKQGVKEGGAADGTPGRNDAAASMVGKLLAGLNDPYDNQLVGLQWEMIAAWNTQNEPPLPHKELKTTFDSILQRHRLKWTSQQTSEATTKSASRDPETGKTSTANWRLVQVLSDPIKWKLFSPWWEHKAKNGQGYIELSSQEIRCVRSIGIAAAEQARHWIPSWFNRLWNGGKGEGGQFEDGIAAALMAAIEIEECSPDENRELVLAELVLQKIWAARESDEVDPRGAPRKLADGAFWFKHKYLLDELQFGAEPCTGKELSKLLKRISATDKQSMIGEQNHRFKRLGEAGLKKLRHLATSGAELSDPVRRATAHLRREPGDEDDDDYQQGRAG